MNLPKLVSKVNLPHNCHAMLLQMPTLHHLADGAAKHSSGLQGSSWSLPGSIQFGGQAQECLVGSLQRMIVRLPFLKEVLISPLIHNNS